MDTLIIGGLLVVGIAAIVGLFFVLRSDDTPTAPATTRNVSQPANESANPSVPISAQQSVLSTGVAQADTRTVPSMETSPEQEAPLKVRLNGQFHELAHGLRSLQQQATEMEQRLGSLNQIIDNIENDSPEER